MIKQITEVTQMTGSAEGLSLLIDSWRNQISQDQQYREFTQNSIESIKRVQKENPEYKGIIKWGIDERYFKKHKVKKLCIIDNGEGMTPQEMLTNINSLGGSTRNNEHYNHGCGAKIAGLAHNREGLLYRSWKNGQGYVAKFMRNEMGRYGAAIANGRNTHELSTNEKPTEIKDHGCMVTLLGDSPEQNTTEPVKGNYGTLLKNSRNSKNEWLSAYLNTKFYHVPNNIKISCSRFTTNTGVTNIIRGHEYGLGLDFEKQDEVQLTKTKVKIFYRENASREQDGRSNKTNYLTNGQLAIVNQDEVIKLEFSSGGGVNPLPAWGLQCLKKNVALVLIPEGQFKQTIERTDLTHEGMSINEQVNLWKTEFREAMPQWLKDIEAKKQLEQKEKDNDTETRLKNLSPLFKKERFFNSETGDAGIEEDEKRKASSKKEHMGDEPDPNPNPDHDPKDEFGKIDAVFGVEIDKSKYKGKKINIINEYPEILKTHEGSSTNIGSFEKSNYTIEINIESDLIVELTEYLHKKFNKIMKPVIVDEVFKLIGLSLKQQVAHVHNRMNASEEEIDSALGSLSLTACAANKDYIIDRLTTKFKNQSNEKPVNNWNGKNEPTLDDSFIHKNNPSMYVSNNSRK